MEANKTGEAKESACAKGARLIQEYMGYNRLLYIDIALVIFHFIFLICLMMSWILAVLIVVFRIPRIVLHLIASKKGDDWVWYTREY